MNYTDELGLKLPELDEAFDLENHWNYNTQKIDNFAATTNTAVGTLESGLASAQSQIAALQGGVHLKGSVNYYADLPADPDDGDAYTVLYFGTSGQEPAGIEYAWVNSSQSWIPIGVDPEAFAKPADITAAIAALDVAEAGGSGKYISAISETNGKISATETTMDTTPTANSTVPVTSGGVAASQAAQDAEIGDIANRGAKNLLKIDAIGATSNHGRTYVKNGITFSLNADGTVSATGTATENAYAYLFFNDEMVHIDDFCNGQHILSGCPANGSSSTYRIYAGKTGYRYDDTGNGRLLPDHGEVAEISLAVFVSSGYTIETPLIFKPMICTAADWAISQKFVPYAPTNRELYETKAEKTEIHDLLANIDSSTTITAYADSLVKGHYTSFIANTDRPTDVPVFDNIFIEIYVYSANTVLIRAFPTGTVYMNQFFQKSKVAGVWRDWYKFEGTAVQSGGASTQSVQPTLMSEAKAKTQEQREEETDA